MTSLTALPITLATVQIERRARAKPVSFGGGQYELDALLICPMTFEPKARAPNVYYW